MEWLADSLWLLPALWPSVAFFWTGCPCCGTTGECNAHFDDFATNSIGGGIYTDFPSPDGDHFVVSGGVLSNEATSIPVPTQGNDHGALIKLFNLGSKIGLTVSVEADLIGSTTYSYSSIGGAATGYRGWGVGINISYFGIDQSTGNGGAMVLRLEEAGATIDARTRLSWSIGGGLTSSSVGSVSLQSVTERCRCEIVNVSNGGNVWDVFGYIDDVQTFSALSKTMVIPTSCKIGVIGERGGKWDNLCVNISRACVTPEDSQIVADITVTPVSGGSSFSDSCTMTPSGGEFTGSDSAASPCGTINYSCRLYCEEADDDATYLLDVIDLEAGVTRTLVVTVTDMDPFAGTASADDFTICGVLCVASITLTGS